MGVASWARGYTPSKESQRVQRKSIVRSWHLPVHLHIGGVMAIARALEWIFASYFLTHIMVTLFFDLQILLPGVYPSTLSDMLTWYTTTFKDSLVAGREPWFMSSLYFETFPQLFFFPVAAYAFWKGNCKWIRTPVIIYAMHIITMVVTYLGHILFTDFSNGKVLGPQTLQERLILSAFYTPFLAIPLVMLLFVLFSSGYKPVEKKEEEIKPLALLLWEAKCANLIKGSVRVS